MNFSEIKDLSDQFIIPTYGRIDVAFSHGNGAYLYDTEGRPYLDFLSGLAVNSLGHNHPRINQVIKEQAREILHTSNLFHIENQAVLARMIAEKSLGGKSFFANSGAEANEAAIKLARLYGNSINPAKNKIISLENSFHGRTLAAITMTGQEKLQKGFEPRPEGFIYTRVNDICELESKMDDTIAAVAIEVIQGESGVRPLTEEFVHAVRNLTLKNNSLMIIDEVQTGMGRTGAWFGYQYYGIMPDVITIAKGLANGVPIGVMHAAPGIQDVLGPKTHASTFGGNHFSTRVAIEVIRILEDGLLEEISRSAEMLYTGLRVLSEKYSFIKEIRGRGLMLAIEVEVSAQELMKKCLENYLVVNAIGESVIRFLPPLIIKEKEIEEALEKLDKSMGKVYTDKHRF